MVLRVLYLLMIAALIYGVARLLRDPSLRAYIASLF